MPPCEALTTTASFASASLIRVMLSATAIGAREAGIGRTRSGQLPRRLLRRWLAAQARSPDRPSRGTSGSRGGLRLSPGRRTLGFGLRWFEEGGGAVLELAL